MSTMSVIPLTGSAPFYNSLTQKEKEDFAKIYDNCGYKLKIDGTGNLYIKRKNEIQVISNGKKEQSIEKRKITELCTGLALLILGLAMTIAITVSTITIINMYG